MCLLTLDATPDCASRHVPLDLSRVPRRLTQLQSSLETPSTIAPACCSESQTSQRCKAVVSARASWYVLSLDSCPRVCKRCPGFLQFAFCSSFCPHHDASASSSSLKPSNMLALDLLPTCSRGILRPGHVTSTTRCGLMLLTAEIDVSAPSPTLAPSFPASPPPRRAPRFSRISPFPFSNCLVPHVSENFRHHPDRLHLSSGGTQARRELQHPDDLR